MLIDIQYLNSTACEGDVQSPFYQIIMLKDHGNFSVDFTNYVCPNYSLIFLSPYQHFQFQFQDLDSRSIKKLEFHGDFYCIEYHKKEVACNGLLFNNIYLSPFVTVTSALFEEIESIFDKIVLERAEDSAFSESVLKSYLQLVLALCSKVKSPQLINSRVYHDELTVGLKFQKLLEAFFLIERSVQFYAYELALGLDSFSKKVKKELGKSPSQFIQDRVVLEAKKLLHLTYLSIKEIAAKLGFEDEFYFSRYFKKNVGISPSSFRERVGISIVAK
ncbi:helix-turn-helix domain-containing protein [Sphingobacterium faecium]|uniref:helix-turn-helix domain-containing protein n=1 Tax=Sphingobacterium faecium TaxID=34087 RepID=UPI0012916E79|nr:helix-turn-helix domain-containing protein [Sphingobacterium faecium]MQP27522.1 helix-turn-helix domain-containing protein [Sphingobacterium faecium]